MYLQKLNSIILVLATALIVTGCDKSDGGGQMGGIPLITLEAGTQTEGNESTTVDFKIVLNQSTTETVTVDYKTESGTALEGSDYIGQTGTIEMAPGELEATVSVEIIDDEIRESVEFFDIVLSNPTNAEIFTAKASANLLDNDESIVIPLFGYETPESYEGYELKWSDEFNGESINTSNWTHEFGNHGWGNNELQDYGDNPKNSYILGGSLVIDAVKEANGTFTSARMISKGKQEFKYGRIDIRAALPYGQGIWPAIWMLGHNIDDVSWPACGEIDIMEMVGHEPSTIHGTAHYGPQGQGWSSFNGNGITLPQGEDFQNEFHVFSLIWEENSIKWLMNGTIFHQISTATVGGNPYPFNNEFFFIVNIAVGGNWPGPPDDTTVFPQRMAIDYIRVFQKQ